MRPGVERALEIFRQGRNVVLVAPTGYGKTTASPLFLEAAGDRAAGLIHVVPLRALVESIATQKFRGVEGLGYQSMDEVEGVPKSPYFLRRLVVATLDSFLFNVYRIPVAEYVKVAAGRSQGHFYAAEAAILTSAVVLDEAHVYTGGIDETAATAFARAAAWYLGRAGVPTVIETATMHSSLVAELAQLIDAKVVYVGGENAQLQAYRQRLGDRLEVVKDDGFEAENDLRWETKLLDPEDAIKAAEELCRDKIVLVIRNTVEKAVSTYQRLRCDEKALIHGLLSRRDRRAALKRAEEIRERGAGAIVATQVIEAGVETDASALVTDAAPMENLAQRAGRLCRHGTKAYPQCRDDRGLVYVVKPEAHRGKVDVYHAERVGKAVEGLQGREVDWRLLANIGGKRTFAELIEAAPPPRDPRTRPLQHIAAGYLANVEDPKLLLQLLNDLGLSSPAREEALVSLAIGIPQDNEYDVVTVELGRLEKLEECLERRDGKPLVVAYDIREGRITVRPAAWLALRKALSRPTEVYRLYEVETVDASPTVGLHLVLNPNCYVQGIGLRL